MPFDERTHGGKGILEYYIELFNETSEIVTVAFLKILAENNYKGILIVSVVAENGYRDCHGGVLRKISSYQHQAEFLYDYINCLLHLKKTGQKIPESLISEKLMKLVKNMNKRKIKMKSEGVALRHAA